ncbi:MAG: ATP-binding protein [candidate division KSB1 bacterium]|nr:ATP-binding protein [candidate division KSB1 bacterium]
MRNAEADNGDLSCNELAGALLQALEYTSAGVVVTDSTGRVVAVNRTQEGLVGVTRANLVGKHIRHLPLLESIPWDAWLGQPARQGPGVGSTQSAPVTHTFAVNGVQIQVRPILDAGDLAGLLVITNADTSAQEGGESELRLLQGWLEFFPQPVALVDAHRRLLAASRAFQQATLGNSFSPFPTCREALCRNQWTCSACVVARVLEGGGGEPTAGGNGEHGGLAALPVKGGGFWERVAVVWLSSMAERASPGQINAPHEDERAAARAQCHLDLRNLALEACGLAGLLVDAQGHVLDHWGAPLPEVPEAAGREGSVLERVLGVDGLAAVQRCVCEHRTFVGHLGPLLPWTLVLPVALPDGEAGGVVAIRVGPEKGETQNGESRLQARLSSFAHLGAALAHELNNSLNAISHRVDCLRIEVSDGIDKTKVEAEVALLKEHVGRIATATAELREVASPPLEEPSHLDVNIVLERALATSLASASKSAISIEKKLDLGLPRILGWATDLERGLRSIIDNAVEAMAGEGRLVVVSRWVDEQNAIQVSITDNGEGIPPERLRRVHEPFFTTRKYRSALGLGLSLAYYTVLRHGGELQVESALHRGTTVTVTFPVEASVVRAKA